MEYNKRQIAKLNDKKLLHKVKKRWVVVSVALLGILGGASAGHAHADVRTPVKTPKANQVTKSAVSRSSLVSSANINTSTSSMASGSAHQFSQQAHHLYAHILTNAMFSQGANVSPASAVNSRLAAPVKTQNQDTASAPRVQFEKWGHTQIKFVSDGEHGNGVGDLAEVEPGAISDAFYEQNNSDTTYGSDSTGEKGCYIVNRYNDNLQLPFDANSNNWVLKFDPGTVLPKHSGVSKGDQAPHPGENSSDVDYEAGAVQTNDYRYLLSSTNRSLWNHFKTMDLTNLNTDNASDLSNLFFGDQSLQKVVLNDADNPNLVEMRGMFADDPQLKEIDFKRFNTSHVTNMDSLFTSDVSLRHLDVSPLATGQVTNMHAMFMSDLALSDLQGLGHFDMSKVTNVISMFARDRALLQLDLPSWSTRQVKSMAGMFSGDSQLRDLDLSGLRTDNVSDMSGMFSQDGQLRKLNLGDFDTRKVQAMFPGATFGGMSFMFAGDDNLHELILGPLTDLNRANQDWNSQFFDQIYDVDGNDSTSAIKQGRQSPGSYYSSGYYNNVILYRQYFSDEQALVDQLLDDPLSPAIRSQIKKDANQVTQLASSADGRLNAAKVDPQVVSAFQTVTSVVSSSRSQASQAAQDMVAARSADASIASYYQSSVAASVAVMNSRTASQAAQSADQSIANSYQDSVSTSVSAANQSLANSYQDSVKHSVSISNGRTANAAARSADSRIANSVSASVSSADSRDASLAAQSADQSLANSYRDSVSTSVSAVNQNLTNSYQDSIERSVSSANSHVASLAAQSADRSLANHYRASVSNSVAVLNREKASAAAISADEAIQASEARQSNAIKSSEARDQSSRFNRPGSLPASFNGQPVSQSVAQSHDSSSLTCNSSVNSTSNNTYRDVSSGQSATDQSANEESSASERFREPVRSIANSAPVQRKSENNSIASSRSTSTGPSESASNSVPSSNVYRGAVLDRSDQSSDSTPADRNQNQAATASGSDGRTFSANHETGLNKHEANSNGVMANQHGVVSEGIRNHGTGQLPSTNESASRDERIAAILLALSLNVSALSAWLKKRRYNL